MTDLEISKALALAIGWTCVLTGELGVTVYTGNKRDRVKPKSRWCVGYRIFDYRDWNVIGPIAERYDLFPKRSAVHDKWRVYINDEFVYADTPQKAIALAVIGAMK